MWFLENGKPAITWSWNLRSLTRYDLGMKNLNINLGIGETPIPILDLELNAQMHNGWGKSARMRIWIQEICHQCDLEIRKLDHCDFGIFDNFGQILDKFDIFVLFFALCKNRNTIHNELGTCSDLSDHYVLSFTQELVHDYFRDKINAYIKQYRLVFF